LIVMVSSPGGLFYFFTAAYSTGKAALDRLTTDLAHELEGTGLCCLGLYPGLVATEKFESFAEEGLIGMTASSLAADGETPLYSGRAVAALARQAYGSPEGAKQLSGTIQWTAEVAVEHGLTDERGRQPLSSRSLRQLSGIAWLPASWVVPWWVLRLLSPRYPSAQSVEPAAPAAPRRANCKCSNV
jgi:NAD(P)-dependent dehydrogenase (short-subunit alcohol dehydrogenase family)